MEEKKIRILFSYHNFIKRESKFAKFDNNYFMVRHAQITTVTTLVPKINESTVRGASSFVHDDGHLGHYPTSAMLNHTEFQFKGLGLGMKLIDKCLTLRESAKVPVLSINNSTRAVIIPINVMHYIHDDGHLTLSTSHHVAW